ncbi:uncharacterized protein LOC129592876 isoform X2 [Paramacrobiotus metropolitanus]|uniref:uncharacterized protein LOC129592876 isoform X2 n=1 Tax=Paramacrobiotus metropolitanus TaxID=2943436 RepID=UPI002445C073|nr:uncharacterized protein LOC129592876 isoform X2 [Paramacrobiotus metropolitanus]
MKENNTNANYTQAVLQLWNITLGLLTWDNKTFNDIPKPENYLETDSNKEPPPPRGYSYWTPIVLIVTVFLIPVSIWVYCCIKERNKGNRRDDLVLAAEQAETGIAPLLSDCKDERTVAVSEGGDLAMLLQRMHEKNLKMEHQTAIRYTIELADGIQFLHHKKIIHSDLKPKNILIKQLSDNQERLLIGDLDDCIKLQGVSTGNKDVSRLRGTQRYMSPEMLSEFAAINGQFPGRKTDIWSLGCIILELANSVIGNQRQWLYNASTGEKVPAGSKIGDEKFIVLVINGFTPFIAKEIPDDLQLCTKPCLSRNPKLRISASSLIETLCSIESKDPAYRVRAAQNGFIQLLQNCQLSTQLSSAKDQQGMIACLANYVFDENFMDKERASKDIYGRGHLVSVRIDKTGELIEPKPFYMDNQVTLAAFFDEADTQIHSKNAAWHARILLQRIPLKSLVESVQLAFTDPKDFHTIGIPPDCGDSVDQINTKLFEVSGRTCYSGCSNLKLARKAYCYVKMWVPKKLLIRKQLNQMRGICNHRLAMGEKTTREDNYPQEEDLVEHMVFRKSSEQQIVLRCPQRDVLVNRQFLVRISTKCDFIFHACSDVYEMKFSSDAVLFVLDAVQGDHLCLHDVEQVPSFFLYEVMALSTIWDCKELKLVSQLAFLEMLCSPKCDPDSIPLEDALECIWDNFDINEPYLGGKIVIAGLLVILSNIKTHLQLELVIDKLSQHLIIQEIIDITPTKRCIEVVVKGLDGKLFVVKTHPSHRVAFVKALVEDMAKTPLDQQRLKFASKVLEDYNTLADYRISHMSTLNLIADPVVNTSLTSSFEQRG